MKKERRSLRYIRLAAFLAGQPPHVSEIELTMAEIEELLGESLPPNSRFPSWWRNDDRRMHSRAWMTAGWRVKSMSQEGSSIVFAREATPE